MHRARHGVCVCVRVLGASMPSLSIPPFQHFNLFTNLEVSRHNQLGFYEGFIMEIYLIKSLAVLIDLQSLSPGWRLGGGRGGELDGPDSSNLQGWLRSFW